MKIYIFKLAFTVLLASFVTLSVSAQTQSTSTTASANAKQAKQQGVSRANTEYTKWQQKYNDMKAKFAKNTAAQESLATIRTDLQKYRSAISSYSSAAIGAASQKANETLKAAHQQLMTDWNAAKAKFGSSSTTTPAKTN
jgi:hypothetical protein